IAESPISPSIEEPALVENKPQPRVEGPGSAEMAAIALANPLLSPTRRPEQAGIGNASDADLAEVRLTGIVIEPDRRVAIFVPNGRKPILREEGETLGEWRIDSISPQAISLTGPAGTRTLEPKPAPNRPT